MSVFPYLIALALGYWAYSDAKRLALRGTAVRPFSPVGWGICVGLVAIVFGIWYLIARPKALRSAPPEAPGTGW